MDITRANQWPRGNYNFDFEHGLSKLAIGHPDALDQGSYWRRAYKTWLESLPDFAKPHAYEFSFAELLLPNTLGSHLIGHGRPNYVNPFNDRLLISACMRTDPKQRKKGRLNAALHASVGTPKLIKTAKLRTDAGLKKEVDKLFSTRADS